VIRLFRAEWSTNCERVGLALAHKGLEAESVMINYSDRSQVEEISGQGLVPVIDDDGRVVNDSRAILAYLEERYPDRPLFPVEPARRAEIELFGDWFERVYKAAPNALEAELELDAPDRELVRRHGGEMRARLAVFERLLDGREYLYGEFGAADCLAYPFLKYSAGRHPADDELFHRILEEHQPLGDDHPRLAGWIARVGERPGAY
jgi:glutathione S-transferase